MNAGNGVGLGEVVFFLALLRDGHLVDHHVQALGLKRGEDAIPFGRLQLGFDAQLLGQGLGQFHFEPGQLAVCIDETEWGVGAFQANADYTLFLDGFQLLTGNRVAEQTGTQQQGDARVEKLFSDYCHDEAPMLLCSGRRL
ncbi:hypothetical protein D3C72_1939780 [compost metagenome]